MAELRSTLAGAYIEEDINGVLVITLAGAYIEESLAVLKNTLSGAYIEEGNTSVRVTIIGAYIEEGFEDDYVQNIFFISGRINISS